MSNYQAIFFDLDGTAIPNRRDGMPSERLVRTVAAHRDRIHLVAATGRPLRYAMPVIEALGLTAPCIISGGTIIIDPADHKVLKITTLPQAAVHAIFSIVKDHPYSLFLREERIASDAPAIHPTLAEDLEIIYVGQVPAADVEHLKSTIETIPNLSANVVPDWSGDGSFAFNITHSDATKEHAVTDVLTRLGVPRAASIGIGDGDNDLHLFRSVGLKIAMGNAGPTLKAAAVLIAPPLDEDGLAQMIERYA
ncbi:MAG TPA: HAD-IIB family hydrolase [Candidatus Saccharimonadia bacterium]|nr:HAD-IIB family hydrolase [Candidatus Saccharimonadia bacterium]